MHHPSALFSCDGLLRAVHYERSECISQAHDLVSVRKVLLPLWTTSRRPIGNQGISNAVDCAFVTDWHSADCMCSKLHMYALTSVLMYVKYQQ